MQEALQLTFVGLTVVFTALLGVIGVIVVMNRLDTQSDERESAQKKAQIDKDPTIDDLTLTLIATAVATVLVGRHQIRSVRRVRHARKTGMWAEAGRAQLHASHSVRPKPETNGLS